MNLTNTIRTISASGNLQRGATLLGRVALFTLCVWVSTLVLGYLFGVLAVERHHIQTAVIWLSAAVLLKWIVARPEPVEAEHDAPPSAGRWGDRWAVLVWITASICLYWSVLHIGLLSDDYVLVSRAQDLDLRAVAPQLFRPTVLLLWGLLFPLAGPFGLHLLNVTLHGINSWLTTVVARRLGCASIPSGLAGMLVLSSPLAPEAVGWIAGGFDVFTATLLLVSILLFVEYDAFAPLWRRALFLFVGVAAIGSKEWAIVIPLLALAAAWSAGRRWTRQQILDAGVMMCMAALFAMWRLIQPGANLLGGRIGRYFVKELAFRPLETLAFPWHADTLSAFPWLPRVATLALLLWLSGWALRTGRSGRPTRLLALGVLTIWLTTAPVFSYLFIGPTLQGSRYLYAASVGWALALTTTLHQVKLRQVLAAIVVGTNLVALPLQLKPWLEAADLRDTAERQIRLLASEQECKSVSIAGLPDSIDGAYVFRNGTAEALERDLGLRLAPAALTDQECRFLWTRQGVEHAPPSR